MTAREIAEAMLAANLGVHSVISNDLRVLVFPAAYARLRAGDAARGGAASDQHLGVAATVRQLGGIRQALPQEAVAHRD